MSILVAGESLIDLIVTPDGAVRASPGGAAFTAARTIARLGHPARFLGRFSADPFGPLLTGELSQDGVELALPDPVQAPTALAVVAVDAAGLPQYWFHLAGTAGFMLDRDEARDAVAAGVTALHIGTLGLVAEPMATELERLVTSLPEPVLLMLDPNCRPRAIPDADPYLARIRRILARTDIVKVSTEDLAFLVPGAGVPEAASSLLGAGPAPSSLPTALRWSGHTPGKVISLLPWRPSRSPTRSGPAMPSAGHSSPGGRNAGWPGRTWQILRGYEPPSPPRPGWPR